MQKFGIGQGATRVEDQRLTTGQGRYIDDINLEGQALAAGRVRHVGDAVAMIVAETAMQAQDAAEAVWVEYEALPAVVETDKAMSAGVAQVLVI